MSTTESYIIFEADQVLTNDHLNEMFDYLDVQERMTRNKLIGIGIVCGLEIDNLGQTISIGKGCGVTSKGYLIVWEQAELTQYIPYTLPAKPLYSPFINTATGKQYELLRMLSDVDAAKIEGGKKPVGPVLKDKVVVMFLEANEKDLKNCDTQDCNEKGRQMDLTAMPLLINKSDMEAIVSKQKKLSGEDGLSNSYIERLGLKEVPMKRFDVKATPLQDAYDIYDAYLLCLNDDLLKNIAEAYSQCYSIFQPVLPAYSTNPFTGLQTDLKKKLDYVKSSMPIYIQYYYDFLDDLIKAYGEFKEKSFDVITECCPDEDLFPMHLMLGEATVDTVDYVRSPFRQYFISSPLFNNQTSLLNQTKVLFDRMVTLTKSLFIPTFNSRAGVPIRITPSKWSQAPLSQRAIPYYYNIDYVSKSWDPVKTSRGRSNYNLSYNADKYSPAPPDMVTNPLAFQIEPYDFYRIEGHIGQQFSSVLNVILSARNTNRLPFDVIALKAGTDASDTTIKYDCHFEDLEAQFTLLRAELACKMHEPLCIAAKVPSTLRVNVNDTSNFVFLNTLSVIHNLALQDVVTNQNLLITSFVQTTTFTRKGDFLKTYCPVTKGTLGNDYVESTNKYFPRPSQVDLTTTSGAKAALLHLIDITEALMQTITGASTIYNFKYTNFNRIYVSMISFFTDFMQALLAADTQQRSLSPLLYGNLEAVVTGCIDEKLKALTDEYTKRVEKIQKQNLLSEYLSSNPGIDHKAGVPRGGTFIIVYHEAPASTANLSAATTALTNITAAASTATLATANATGAASTASTTPSTKLADTSVITKNNLTKILNLFNTSELALTAEQATTLKNLTLQQFTTAAAAARVPFNIANNTVIADFYLPYLCCSDCPPVTYVLPKVQQDILLLTLEKTDFCNNDDKTYKVTVNPLGGTLTASAGGIDADKMEFRPARLAAGVNKITYTLPDERSISVDVKITAASDVEFEFRPTTEDPFAIKFLPGNTENKTVSWNFGDGTATSVDQSPTHKFTLTTDPQTFLVTLTATDGLCVATRQHEVTISKPKQQIFSIKPDLFCSNDERKYSFTADPVISKLTDIENPNGLTMETDADGNVFFVPAKQIIRQKTGYHLVYKGIAVDLTIVPAFGVQFSANPVDGSPLSRRFVPVNADGKQVQWNFGDGSPVSTETSPTHDFKISGASQTFKVLLTVTDGPCTATSEQTLEISQPRQDVFVIEPAAFCASDKAKKLIKIDPVPTGISDIRNPQKLIIEQDANTKELFFIPAKQGIGQTTQYTLTYRSVTTSITIFVANAGFTMNIVQNPSPVAVFPVLLTLKAKDQNADSYAWKLSNNFGKSVDFTGPNVESFNMSNLADPNNSIVPITIVLTLNYNKRTGVTCSDSRNYIITGDVMGNHRNKGEFDNLSPA